MKVYLAGPMSGLPDFNYPAFHERASALRSQGHTVFNPAEADNGDTSQAWDYYLRKDIKALPDYEAVAVLPGWESSKGARLEVSIARALNMKVLDAVALEPVANLPEDNPLFEHYKDLYAHCQQLEAELLIIKSQKEGPVTLEAHSLVNGNRGSDYGHPYDDFLRTSEMANALFGTDVFTPERVALFMILVKLSREANKPKRDNRVDICGYAETLEKVYEKKRALGV